MLDIQRLEFRAEDGMKGRRERKEDSNNGDSDGEVSV